MLPRLALNSLAFYLSFLSSWSYTCVLPTEFMIGSLIFILFFNIFIFINMLNIKICSCL